ncbi:LuxR C-terminal-related transcriptional regulator [Sphaerisporangium sp. NPDC051017]|uniref:ATP-binding protein n=1 Tax=Sphaerisporangium sp. NPDC051017 TaxID=3154636 RepID=UPI003428B34D
MELWERTSVLDVLDDLLRGSSGGGRIALVAGEAGLGKSSLVTEFARRCGTRARVLWGGCDRMVTPRALGPLHDIGRQTGGLLADRLNAYGAQEEIFTAFLDELTGPRQRPRPVVVVEDAHWADGATLDWLAFLGRRIGRLSALLVVTYRDDEVGVEHPLRGTLASLPSTIVRRVTLPPLSEACVAEQARRMGRDAGTIHRLTGGNPLLVTELLKTDGDAVPEAVQDLILDRLRALPSPARELAQLVAVIPTRADAAIVAGASELVDLCIGAGVLVPAGDGVSYRHELLRNAVEDSLSPARRASLHQRALGILSQVTGIDPSRLVHHARLAGDSAAVLRHARTAGADAARQGAHREAAAHYQAAAATADRLPEPQRAELLEAYAVEAHLTGLYKEGLQARQTALAIREALGQPEEAGENLRWISRLAWLTGRAALAWETAARAVTLLEAGPPSRRLAMAYSNQSQLYMLAYKFDQAVTWGERARELAERLGDLDTAIHVTINVNTARLADGDTDAWTAMEQTHERAAAHGFFEHGARALSNLGNIAADELAQYAAAASPIDRVLEYAKRHDLDGWIHHILGTRARIRMERGDWSGALADADAALRRMGLLGVGAVWPLIVRGRIQAAGGHPEALSTLDEAARQAAGIRDAQFVLPVAAARSEYFLWYGDVERAQEEARRGLALALSVSRQPFVIGRIAYALWRAGGTDPLPATIAAPYQMMITGDWDGAAKEWARRGAVFLRAKALSGGDRSAAVEALRILDGLGATVAAEHLRAELRVRGLSRIPRGPRRATAANVAGLTARQVDVLALLADGLSNAQIAQRLTLSAKTVEHHVSAVLHKLGVANRAQAAAAAHRMNLGDGEAGRDPR